MSAGRRLHNVSVALDRLLLVRRRAARLRGQTHRMHSHGLGDAAKLYDEHLDDLNRAVDAIDEAVAQLLAASEPGMDDTIPTGLRLPRG